MMERFLVVSLSIGTNYSGCSCSIRPEFEKDILKLWSPQWLSRGGVTEPMSPVWQHDYISKKVPTCILFNPKGEFDSFGYDAEDKYTSLQEENQYQQWYFFRRFTMCLDVEQVQAGIDIADDKGLKMAAKKVFGMAIRYLKEHVLAIVENTKLRGFRTEDVHWVLPVPATWTVSAKEFMREAANEAGIDVKLLITVLESEAAAMYCMDKFDGGKFIVVDLGDENEKITAHEKEPDGTFKMVYTVSNKSITGPVVSEGLKKMIINIFGAPTFKTFCDEFEDDHMHMIRDLKITLRGIRLDTNRTIVLRVPTALLEVHNERSKETMEDAIRRSPYKGKIRWKNKSMLIDADLFKRVFQDPMSRINKRLLDILEKPGVKGTSTFLMVGRFSEFMLVQESVTKAFPYIKVIIPDDPDDVILKGAVMMGHILRAISKQDEDDVSSDDIANLPKCSNAYDQGNYHDWPKDLNSKSLGEDEQELSSSDSVGMNARRQDEDTAALENRLENQMTLKADVKRSPSDDELFTLSRKLDTFNKGWWFLAKLLGLSDDKIDELEHGGADIIRQYYKMLTAWRNQNTGQEKGSVGYLLRQCDEAGIDREVTLSVFGN